MSLLSRLRRPSTAAGEAATPADLPAPTVESTGGTPTPTDDTAPTPGRARWRTVAARVTTVLAALLILAVLTAPDRLDLVTPAAFLRVPIEGLVAAALLLALPGRARRLVAVPVGGGAGAGRRRKLLDLGFSASFARPFDLVLDWVLLDDGGTPSSPTRWAPAARSPRRRAGRPAGRPARCSPPCRCRG